MRTPSAKKAPQANWSPDYEVTAYRLLIIRGSNDLQWLATNPFLFCADPGRDKTARSVHGARPVACVSGCRTKLEALRHRSIDRNAECRS